MPTLTQRPRRPKRKPDDWKHKWAAAVGAISLSTGASAFYHGFDSLAEVNERLHRDGVFLSEVLAGAHRIHEAAHSDALKTERVLGVSVSPTEAPAGGGPIVHRDGKAYIVNSDPNSALESAKRFAFLAGAGRMLIDTPDSKRYVITSIGIDDAVRMGREIDTSVRETELRESFVRGQLMKREIDRDRVDYENTRPGIGERPPSDEHARERDPYHF